MDLPDCPPGAEGYEDSVVEVPKKPEIEDDCTKAEKEFQEHLNSLKIKLEDGTTRCMVERRGRDISEKWIYLCYPCAAVCSGESILQTHISGKKHKTKLILKSTWPTSIFENHPFVQSAAAKTPGTVTATEKVLQKMAEEVDLHNSSSSDLESKFFRYRDVTCHIQEFLDAIKAPILGAEYLVEHPPDEPHHEPSYVCTLCNKQGHPRTIVNHMTCFWHRSHYLMRYFPKACALLAPYRTQNKYREATNLILFRLAQRIQAKYGRLRPLHIEKDEYEANKEAIHQWINRMPHFSENDGATFEEVVDFGVIDSLDAEKQTSTRPSKRDPSPPIVAVPKPHFNNFSRPSGRTERRAESRTSLSDVSDEEPRRRDVAKDDMISNHDKVRPLYEPYPQRRVNSPSRAPRYTHKSRRYDVQATDGEKQRPKNYEYKVKLTEEKRQSIEESLKKTLAYHQKNPEKHPLYPEEWKKFWNRRYKEIQAEGKDPSKHDFKPEWILFWTTRIKEMYEEELRVQVEELYRRMRLSPPTDKPVESRHKSPERRPEPRRRSPPPRRRSPEHRRTPEHRRRSPPRRRSPDMRRQDSRRPYPRRSPGRDHVPDQRSRSPRHMRTRSRSPIPRRHSLARTHISLEVPRGRSRSPLSQRSQRDALNTRNRSPEQERSVAPSLQTVLVSDDELKTDDLSPWNSDNEIISVESVHEARSPVGSLRSASVVSSRGSRARHSSRDMRSSRPPPPQEYGPPENIVATLRLLVALEDYLGSIGPKIVDLLTEALKMEKENANSSEDLLVRENAVVLIETAKEKLKGAAQAGLVPSAAAGAVRAAIVRAAATLHEADNRAKSNKKAMVASKPAGLPVAGVGEVDRAEIAQQMAAALIAQGKTDVSSEELAQLVDAVVGMAEAKKREADRQRVAASFTKPSMHERLTKMAGSSGLSGTASALQMLQSAYDENDKRIDKEDALDAMDGLSDSDLETLLKNFNELSAEEQHSLIAYLKKLEAKEPIRVERLRKYVGDAAAGAPKSETKSDVPAMTIDSDDDDYTVEEVFQSATQKVKEDHMRQALATVKKTLDQPPPAAKPPASDAPALDLPQNVSSTTDHVAMENANSSEDLLGRENAVILIETAKEKLKGAAQAGLVPSAAASAVRAAIARAAATLHEADNRTKSSKKSMVASKSAGVPAAGVVDRGEIAQQMAAALIAQGKTDVSSDELAQLVDAVVGMAEAKKRETDRQRVASSFTKPSMQERLIKMAGSSGLSGTASALQLLQSAYDENNKRIDKEDAPDAMDGLSDTDLETLLKNFNELSAEEQHSLIAYLKKLEAKEPTRVERLRKYVGDAAAGAPKSETKSDVLAVAIDSDDDDYTVEEVFQSATQKVKEDQIRQALEIVKKSLEEHQPPPAATPAASDAPTVDLPQSFSSATDLFALVQASLKSTPGPTIPSVVDSNTQPRSFGDKPEVAVNVDALKIPLSTANSAPNAITQPTSMDLDNTQNNPHDGGKDNDDKYNRGNDNYNQGNDNYNQGNDYNQAGDYSQNVDNYNQQNVNYNQDPDNFYQGGDNYNGNDNFNPGNANFNPGNANFNPGNANFNTGNANFQPGNNNFNPSNGNFNPGNDNFNPGNDNFNPGNDYNQQNDFYNQGNNFNPMQNFNQASWNPRPPIDVRRPPMRGSNFAQKPFNQANRGNVRGHNIRPQNQNNFRGRGRGNRGSGRGRGRGHF